MTKDILKILNLSKSYNYKNSQYSILENINLNIKEKDIISIIGPSGVGKSTLLNIIGLLDDFNSGEYSFFGQNVKEINNKNLNLFRNSNIGFVHQFFHLIPELTILENVALPNMIQNTNNKNSYELAEYFLKIFKLQDRMNFKPIYLSGGEQQRVAIARALINKPKILIADEITGNLDEETAENVFNFFMEQIKENKQTLIFATHNQKFANLGNIKLQLKHKKLENI